MLEFLSRDIVSSDFRDCLRQDMERSNICRFLIAYVSEAGIHAIGFHELLRLLGDSRSFGVASLSCVTGYKPLLQLQDWLPDIRLKYFMDPMLKKTDEPQQIALLHSKLIYLANDQTGFAVIYIGSHNWSERALGPNGARNVEASIRYEVFFNAEDLKGEGVSLVSQVNQHILDAYKLKACLPATNENEERFKQWKERACPSSSTTNTEENTVILCVRKVSGPIITAADWEALVGHGIYLQSLVENDGDTVWRRSGDRALLLVWMSDADFSAAKQPVIIRCRETTRNAGSTSKRRGTNSARAPIGGFKATILDEHQLNAERQRGSARARTMRMWNGLSVEVFDFLYPANHSDCAAVDSGVDAKYQFHFDVEAVVLPADAEMRGRPSHVWQRETLAFAETRKDARYEDVPGYEVPAEQEEEILRCLTEKLHVNPRDAKVLPVSNCNWDRIGKRFAYHPLHDSYFSPELKERRAEFYKSGRTEIIIPELDPPESRDFKTSQPKPTDKTAPKLLFQPEPNPIRRVLRVFTSPIQDLERVWASIATEYFSQGDD